MFVRPDLQPRKEKCGQEVRVDVRCLVVDVRPALETVEHRVCRRPVSVEDEVVVLVPGGDLVEGEQDQLVHGADGSAGMR